MRHRPRVAITGPKRGGIARFCIALGVLLAGGWPKRYPPGRSLDDAAFDALIISGGDDLNHALYEQPFCDLDDIITCERDAQEYRLLHMAHAQGCPVLGICRGHQLINVYFGGTLDKDISITMGPIRYSVFAWKEIRLTPSSWLKTVFGRLHIPINTLHHQAVDRVAEGFLPTAHDRHGIVQAIEHDRLPIYGVQWHPEYLLYLPSHFRIFKTLIRQSSGGK